MQELIMKMVNFMFEAISGFAGNEVINPETFNTILFEESIFICNNIVRPIGYTLMSLFGLLEIINITTRTQSQHSVLGFEIPMKFMIKFALAKLFLDKIDMILMAINQVSMELIDGIAYVGEPMNNINDGQEAIRTTIETQGFIELIGTFAVVLILWVLFLLMFITILAIMYGRSLQFYLYVAIAPIPFSTLANSEISSIGKNYLKSFSAICLQGVLIFLVLRFYGTLANQVLSTVDFTSMLDVFVKMLVTYAALLLTLVVSGSMAKSVMNAM